MFCFNCFIYVLYCTVTRYFWFLQRWIHGQHLRKILQGHLYGIGNVFNPGHSVSYPFTSRVTSRVPSSARPLPGFSPPRKRMGQRPVHQTTRCADEEEEGAAGGYMTADLTEEEQGFIDRTAAECDWTSCQPSWMNYSRSMVSFKLMERFQLKNVRWKQLSINSTE